MPLALLDTFPGFTRKSPQGLATPAGWAEHTPYLGTVPQPRAGN